MCGRSIYLRTFGEFRVSMSVNPPDPFWVLGKYCSHQKPLAEHSDFFQDFRLLQRLLFRRLFPLCLSKKFPTGRTEWTPKPEYLIALATYLGFHWQGPIQFLIDFNRKNTFQDFDPKKNADLCKPPNAVDPQQESLKWAKFKKEKREEEILGKPKKRFYPPGNHHMSQENRPFEDLFRIEGGNLGSGNSNICYFSPRKLGKMNPFRRAYFSDGLKPPTRKRALYPPGNEQSHITLFFSLFVPIFLGICYFFTLSWSN